MQMDVDAMNADLRAKFEQARAKCPEVPPEMVWAGVKAAILASEILAGLHRKGVEVTPDLMAKVFVECVKHVDKA